MRQTKTHDDELLRHFLIKDKKLALLASRGWAITQPFDRIAYYWELTKASGGSDWVYVSVNAFTADKAKIGIPNTASGAFFQQTLSNMNVASNVAGIVQGTGIATGNIEFWPSNYSGPTTTLIPTGSGVYDWNDSGAGTSSGHASMQIHNYDVDGSGHGTAGQTLFAYNAWGTARTSELGLGNQPGGAGTNPDWTFNTTNISTYTSRTLQVLVRQVNTAVPPKLVQNVPELADYELVYQKTLPNLATYNTTGVAYDVDNSANIPSGSFDRVAYYVQLDGNFAAVSFDAAGFTNSAAKIGIPTTASGEFYQQNLTNMNVTSNVAGIFNGTGLATGNIEFWPSSYSAPKAATSPANASDAVYDFGDSGASTGGGYGSMQVHNYGAGQTIFAYNRWNNGSTSDLGIGNRPTSSPDWTFAQNASSYATKVLYVLVRPAQVQTLPPTPVAPPAPATLVSNAPELADYQLVYRKELPLTANYSSGPVAYDENYVSRVPYGSFDRVAYYLQLDGNFVEVSFNADGFTSAAGMIGIPNAFSGENYQQYVQNVNVTSNVAGVVTGTGIGTGNVEFWPNNYQESNSGQNAGLPAAFPVPGSSGGTFDFGDRQSSGSHGSMQIHNYNAGQTLFAYNNWNTSGYSSLGIGNQPTGQPDWTYNYNTPSYTTRSLYVLVRPRHTGTPADDQVLLKKVNGIAQYTVNGGWPVTLSGDTALQIDGLAGNDTVTIDFSGGDPIPAGGVIFDGGDGSDSMKVIGGTFATVTHRFTGPGAGNLDLDGDGVEEITYTGLEPFLMTSGIGDLVLDIQQAGVTDAVLRDYTGAGDAGHSELAFTADSAEDFQFTGPSSSLTVRTYGGSVISVAGFDAAFNTPDLIFEDPSGTASRFALAASEVMPDAIDVKVTGKAVWDLNGGTETIDGLSGTGTVDNTAAGTAALVVGSGGASSTFDGAIRDTGGDMSLAKSGGGTLTLSGVNTYAGATTIAAGTLQIAGGGGAGGVFAHMPEAAGYNLVYELPIGNSNNFTSGVPYSVNNAALIPSGSFSRVGYYLELKQGANPLQWVYTSFDAAPFATTASKLGVPNATSGIVYYYDAAGLLPGQVRNMNVYSNVPGLVGSDRTGVTTGNVEFWATDYSASNANNVPNASGSTYDWGDAKSAGGSHGSMQVADHGAQKMLFSFNNWNGGGGVLGIGNQPSGHPDYTFGTGVGSYSVKTLQIVADAHVSQAIPAASPVVIAAGASLDLNGYSATVGSLADGAGGGGWVVNSDPARPVTFTVNPASGSTTFSGTIGGDSDANAITLTKTGAGTQILGGHNTYHGDTNVNGGTLQLLQGADQQPLAVTGWNQDFIWANSEPAALDGTTCELNNWVYYEKNATRNGGLNGMPSSRSFVSAFDPDVTFQVQPYDTLNTLLTTTTPATLTLANPDRFASLNVLTAKGNATVTYTYTLNFADSSTTSGTFQPPDWTAPNAITTSLARRSNSGGAYYNNAGLSEHDIVLSAADQAKVLNSITFTAAGGGGSWIMGLSGELLTVPSTDILPNTSRVSIASGATLDLAGNDETIGPLSGAGGTVSLGVGTVTVNSSDGVNPVDATFTGQITGSGGLVKDGGGTFTLRGVNTYGGSTIIETGTLRLEGGLAAGAKIMPLGDSITYGSGGTNAGYRGPLYSLLTGAGYSFQYVGSTNGNPGSLPTTPVNQTYHEGHGGWVTGDVSTGILHGVKTVAAGGLGWLTVNPDVILLHIGTNNTGGSEPQSIIDVGNILDEIHTQRPTAVTYVAQIVPKVSGGVQLPWVTQYNTDLPALVASKQTLGYSVAIADLNTNYPTPWSTTLPDNVHPNSTGYAWMAQQWFDAIVTGGGLGGVNVLPATTAVSIASGATLDLNGVTQTIASLSDYGLGGGTVVNGAAATPLSLTIAPTSGSTTFSGTIDDSGAPNALTLVKTNAGTQVLSGHNTYHGDTNVNGGTLQLPQGAGQQPLAVTGWNQDIIIDKTESAPGYSASMAGWLFYETGLAGSTQGLAANSGATPRTFTSLYDGDVEFQFAPYAGNNAVYLDGPGNVTLTLANPARFESLQLLETTRTMSWYAKLNFADGSSTITSTWNDPDWTANPGPADRALASYGLKNTNGSFYSNYLWMAQRDVTLSAADQAKVLNSITIFTTSAVGQQLAVFAVSGIVLSVPSTDILPDTSRVSIASGATLDLAGNDETIGPLSGAGGTVSLGVGTVTVNSSDGVNPVDATFTGQITGSGGLVKDGGGTFTLRGVNTYGGSTIIETGTLRLEGGLAAGAKIMPTGDSITYGSSGTNAGYRGPLYSLLNSAGYTTQYVGSQTNNPGSLPTAPINQTHHEGHSGWNVAQVLNGVTPIAQGGLGWLDVDPDVITLMIGTNNRGGDVPTAISQLGQIIDTVHTQKPKTQLMVAEIIPIPAQPAWVSQYNTALISLVNSKQAMGDNVVLVDLNTNFPSSGLADALHPNDTGYAWMAQQWFDAIVAGGALGGINVLPTTTAVSIPSGATLDLNGVTQTIASLSDYAGGGGTVVNGAAAAALTLTIAPAGGSTTFSGTIDDGGAANALTLVKNGAGTLVLAGDNAYSGPTTVNAGTLVVATDTALGGTAGGTAVRDGGTLALPGGVTISGEAFTLNGTGAAGQPGALVNLNGTNTIAASSPITAQSVLGGQIGIGSVAGTLTIDAPIDLQYSKLTVTGAGDTVLNGDISSGSVNDLTATDVFTNVPEADGYTLAYELIPNGGVTGASFPYTVNNTAAIGAFDRVAYYLELDGVWVYASMDAFTANVNQIGIPYGSTLFKWQQKVNNLNVFASAGSGISSGTGLATGNLEIWPSNYGGGNDLSIPNASGSTFDFGDGGAGTSVGYGSLQVHNYDLDGAGPGTVGQTLLAYNDWRNSADLGIGNRPTADPDWTFADNYASYTWRRLAVLVRETGADTSLTKEGFGVLTLSGDNSYGGATMIAEGTLIAASNNALGFTGEGTTVQDGATLALQGGITISGEALTLNGLGAPGQPGALVNLSDANTIADTSPITAELVSLGQAGIGSVTDILTIDAGIDLQLSGLIVAGGGDVVVNGVISGIGAPLDTSLPHHTNTQVFNNVAEADDYVVAYELPIPATNIRFRDTNPVPYSIDDTALINPFDRIAYYLELDTGTGLRWVYASMNAFTSNISQIGLPHNVNNPVKFQQIVNNTNVFSNVAGVTTGTGITTGNIEFWPSNYGGDTTPLIPTGTSAFDWNDSGGSTGAGHGSFQVHNYAGGPTGLGETLFGFSDWGGNNTTGNVELGIGTNSGTVQTLGGPVSVGGNPDWTFADASHLYTVKNLVVLVHEATPRPILYPDNNLHKTGMGTLTLAGANTYNGPTTIGGGAVWVYGSLADGPAADDVIVDGGGTIGGTGTIYGQVRVNSGGTAAPGDTPGVIASDTLILTGGSTFEVELEGTTPGNGAGYHDQWIISDSVDLGGAALSVLFGTFTPPAGSAYVIVRNDSANPVAGTFNGLDNGDSLTVGSTTFLVFHTGGDGNDVVLVEASDPPADVYVDNDWAGYALGQFITDADDGTAADEFAVFGVNAFETVTAGVGAAATGGTVIVNDGTYPAADLPNLGAGKTLQLTRKDQGAADSTVTIASLDSALGTTVDLGSNTLVLGNNATANTIAGTITGAGNLTKQGSDQLTLGGNNTYSGATTVSGGELVVAHNSALGATAGDTTIASGARVVLANGVTVTGETITIAGNGGNYGGALQAAAGASAEWAGPVKLDGLARVGTADTGGSAAVLTISGVIQNGTGNALDISGGQGNGTDNDDGTVILKGANSYTGATNLIRGTLQLGADNSLPVTTTLDTHSAGTDVATFDLHGFNQTVADLKRTVASSGTVTNEAASTTSTLTVNTTSPTSSFGGAIQDGAGGSGIVAVTKSGSGSLTLSGPNMHQGATAVSAGVLVAASNTALGGTTGATSVRAVDLIYTYLW